LTRFQAHPVRLQSDPSFFKQLGQRDSNLRLLPCRIVATKDATPIVSLS